MTVFSRILPFSLILLLTACATQQEEEFVVLEPEPVSEGPDIGRVDDACDPGTDDGIGGTGCSVD